VRNKWKNEEGPKRPKGPKNCPPKSKVPIIEVGRTLSKNRGKIWAFWAHFGPPTKVFQIHQNNT